MLSFSMIVFLLQAGMCTELEKLINKYWLTSSADRRGINWKSWQNLCKSIDIGRMGFKNLRHFNLAMLGKQCWRLIINPENLIGRIFKASYFSSGISLILLWKATLVLFIGVCLR